MLHAVADLKKITLSLSEMLLVRIRGLIDANPDQVTLVDDGVKKGARGERSSAGSSAGRSTRWNGSPFYKFFPLQLCTTLTDAGIMLGGIDSQGVMSR